MRPLFYDPRPLKVSDCATWMGFTQTWVRDAINQGVTTKAGARVKLEAETLSINGRNVHRIHVDAFVTFLKAIGWKHLPTVPAPPSASQLEASE